MLFLFLVNKKKHTHKHSKLLLYFDKQIYKHIILKVTNKSFFLSEIDFFPQILLHLPPFYRKKRESALIFKFKFNLKLQSITNMPTRLVTLEFVLFLSLQKPHLG